jgi:uncharacterized protein (DUF1697 family)
MSTSARCATAATPGDPFRDHHQVTTWIALLRGINIRSNRRVPMPDLRDLLAGLGYPDARTWIVSGNAWFTADRDDAAAMQTEIEAAVERRFGFDVAVVLRRLEELEATVRSNPLPDAVHDPAHFYAVFLSEEPSRARLDAIDPEAVAPDVFAVGDRVIYAWYRNGLQASKLAGLLTDRGLGVTATARNWNTTTKLLELASG